MIASSVVDFCVFRRIYAFWKRLIATLGGCGPASSQTLLPLSIVHFLLNCFVCTLVCITLPTGVRLHLVPRINLKFSHFHERFLLSFPGKMRCWNLTRRRFHILRWLLVIPRGITKISKRSNGLIHRPSCSWSIHLFKSPANAMKICFSSHFFCGERWCVTYEFVQMT